MRIVNNKQTELDISTRESLLLLIHCANERLNKIMSIHPFSGVEDVGGFGLVILSKNLKLLRTLVAVCVYDQDYVVANAIVRMLADSMAVYKLIYAVEDEDEKTYRHYLYVKDGLSSRADSMKYDLVYNKDIPYEVFQALNDRYTTTRQSDEKVINHCDEILGNHRYATLYPEFHRRTCIESSNWKYKNLGSIQKTKNNQYTWKELYGLIDKRDDVVNCISSHLSQYIHGLCVSNIISNEDEGEFEPLLSFGMVFIGLINKELDRF